MPNHAPCAVGFCDNDKRYPDLVYVRSHVKKLTFHKWPVAPKLAEIWRKQVVKTCGDVFNPLPGASGTFVCSNHFPLGRRTPENPKTDYLSIFMTVSDYLQKSRLRKGKWTSCKKLVPQDACLAKRVMMIVRKLMKNWKPVRTIPCFWIKDPNHQSSKITFRLYVLVFCKYFYNDN